MSTFRLLLLLGALFTAGYLLGRSSLVFGTSTLLAASEYALSASRSAVALTLIFGVIALSAERLAALEAAIANDGRHTPAPTLSACENLRRRGSF